MPPPRKHLEFADLSPEEYRLAVSRKKYETTKRSLKYYYEHKATGRPVGRPRKESVDPEGTPPPKRGVGRPRRQLVQTI